jgi:hypothetical protein
MDKDASVKKGQTRCDQCSKLAAVILSDGGAFCADHLPVAKKAGTDRSLKEAGRSLADQHNPE